MDSLEANMRLAECYVEWSALTAALEDVRTRAERWTEESVKELRAWLSQPWLQADISAR